MKKKFSKQRFKDHLYYSKGLYVIFIASALIIFSMVYSITRPKVPKEFKIDVSIFGASLQDAEKSLWEQEILALLTQDQQEVNINSMGFSGENIDTMGHTFYELLYARIAAKEGDIFILSKDIYMNIALEWLIRSTLTRARINLSDSTNILLK